MGHVTAASARPRKENQALYALVHDLSDFSASPPSTNSKQLPEPRERNGELLVGNHRAQLDPNSGLLTLPHPFRRAFSDSTIVTMPSPEGSLWMFSNHEFERIAIQLRRSIMAGKIPPIALENFYGSAFSLSLKRNRDSTLAIEIPRPLLKHLGGSSECSSLTLMGCGNLIEIWTNEKIEENARSDSPVRITPFQFDKLYERHTPVDATPDISTRYGRVESLLAKFVGVHRSTIDQEGNIEVPKLWKPDLLADELYMFETPGHGGWVLPGAEVDWITKAIRSTTSSPEEVHYLKEQFLGGLAPIHTENGGTFQVPNRMRAKLDIDEGESQVVLIGRGGSFEVWSPKRHHRFLNSPHLKKIQKFEGVAIVRLELCRDQELLKAVRKQVLGHKTQNFRGLIATSRKGNSVQVPDICLNKFASLDIMIIRAPNNRLWVVEHEKFARLRDSLLRSPGDTCQLPIEERDMRDLLESMFLVHPKRESLEDNRLLLNTDQADWLKLRRAKSLHLHDYGGFLEVENDSISA